MLNELRIDIAAMGIHECPDIQQTNNNEKRLKK